MRPFRAKNQAVGFALLHVLGAWHTVASWDFKLPALGAVVSFGLEAADVLDCLHERH